ncbi:MAG: hypothetical protein KKA54_03530 [Proteobacteria bacterium]|nr:hypothetical protein [Pseudomonadota bacterium]MBU0965435.1 hypothetical protein [Pseudomonadota bacterium]
MGLKTKVQNYEIGFELPRVPAPLTKKSQKREPGLEILKTDIPRPGPVFSDPVFSGEAGAVASLPAGRITREEKPAIWQRQEVGWREA